jgi:hypothetical protein
MVAGDITEQQISLLHKKVMSGEYFMHGKLQKTREMLALENNPK